MRTKSIIVSIIVTAIILFSVIWCVRQKDAEPEAGKDYVFITNKQTTVMRDSTEYFKNRADSLTKVKRGIKLVPYSVLVRDTVYLPVACVEVASELLIQVSKRDSIINTDSLIIGAQKGEIKHLHAIDSVTTKSLAECQADKISEEKKLKGKLEVEKKKTKVLGIISAIEALLLIFARL